MHEAASRTVRIAGALLTLALLAGCDWAQPNYGPERSRFNPETGITADNVGSLSVQWADTFTGGTSAPLVAGDRVFFTHTDPTAGTIDAEAVDAATGAPAWDTNLITHVGSPLLFGFGAALSGDRLWTSYADPAGTALVRLDRDTGAIVGSDAEFVSSPVVTGDDVIAYTRPDGGFTETLLVVRDASSLAPLWTATVPGSGSGMIAISHGRLYLAAGSSVYAFTPSGCGATTCAPLWQRSTTGTSINALAVGPDDQVVTTTPFQWLTVNGQNRPSPSFLKAYDGATGTDLWSGAVTSTTSGLAITADTVFVTEQQVAANPNPPSSPAMGSNRLAAFPLAGCGAATCSALWEAAFPTAPSPPVVGGDVVFTAVEDTLSALDADGCGSAGCAPLASFPGLGSPAAVANGRLLTTSAGGSGTTTLRAVAPS